VADSSRQKTADELALEQRAREILRSKTATATKPEPVAAAPAAVAAKANEERGVAELRKEMTPSARALEQPIDARARELARQEPERRFLRGRLAELGAT
jgi:hypothetical protein